MSHDLRLTRYASCAGCAAKLSPGDLTQVLRSMPPMLDPDLLEGFENFSDAGAFRLRGDLAIVQTIDFFPPIIDGPEEYGQIAAANALSDCYAMGATPVTALSVVAFPQAELDISILGRILAGGAQKVIEAGAVILGGHSIKDKEIKFGLAVTGVVNPEELLRNSGARAGDVLVLTKAIGIGAISTAGKTGDVDVEVLRGAIESMKTLNRDAAEAMRRAGARAATDITGFGLLGHSREMADASGVTLAIDAAQVPVLPGARDLARRNVLSGSAARNGAFLANKVRVDGAVPPDLASLFFDSETSGGLLIALPDERAAAGLLEEMHGKGHAAAAIIGRVVPHSNHSVEVRA